LKRQLFFFNKNDNNGNKCIVEGTQNKKFLRKTEKIKYWLKVHPQPMSTISTGLFNNSGALSAPVINANQVTFTNPVQYINAPSTSVTTVAVKPTTSALTGKVFVMQGGTSPSTFQLAVNAAKLGCTVYCMSRAKYWLDWVIEVYEAGMIGPSPLYALLDASAGLVKGTYTNNDSSANVLNDRLPTYTVGSGKIVWLQTDAKAANVAFADPTPTTRAGYIANAALYAAQPWLKELLWFTVEDSRGPTYGDACPSISLSGALGYIKKKEGKVNTIFTSGGSHPYSKSLAGAVNNAVNGNSGFDASTAVLSCPLVNDYVGSANVTELMIMVPNDNPFGPPVDPATNIFPNYGTGEDQLSSAQQLLIPSVIACEINKFMYSNVDLSSNTMIPMRVGNWNSNSGKPEQDAGGDLIRRMPYNLAWKLGRQICKQLSTQGVQSGITTFHAGAGGLWHKTLGFAYYAIISSYACGYSLDLDSYLADGSIVSTVPPVNHMHYLYQGNPAKGFAPDASYNVDYFNLHDGFRYAPDPSKGNQVRAQFKNYKYNPSNTLGAGGSALTPQQWLANATVGTGPTGVGGTWIDAITLSKTMGVNLLIGAVWAGKRDSFVPPTVASPLANADTATKINLGLSAGGLSSVRILPNGFSLPNANVSAYISAAQTSSPISSEGTMKPFDVASRLFDLLFNNSPVSTGEYIDMDGSAFCDALRVTSNPLTRWTMNSSARCLPTILPTLPYQAAGNSAYTEETWASQYKQITGKDFATENLYNPGGLFAPVENKRFTKFKAFNMFLITSLITLNFSLTKIEKYLTLLILLKK